MHNSKPDAQWKKTLLPKPNKQQESKEDNQFQRERKKIGFPQKERQEKKEFREGDELKMRCARMEDGKWVDVNWLVCYGHRKVPK